MEDVIERFKQDIKASPRGRVVEVAQGSGVKLKTLRNVVYGETVALSYENVKKLAAYYQTGSQPPPAAAEARP